MTQMSSQIKKDEKPEKNDDGKAVTVVLWAGLHCEGCARKVKRSLIKHLDGVEKVKANYESKKITVVGKVDPAKVKEKVEEKTKKPAHLISPKPKPKPANKVNDIGAIKPDENPVQIKSPVHQNKDNSVVNAPDEIKAEEVADVGETIVLKTRVHCDNCVRKINKIIKKYEGVEGVNVDLEKDKITIKGKMDMKEMLPYLNTKLKRLVEMAPRAAAAANVNQNSKSKVDKVEKQEKMKKEEEKAEIREGEKAKMNSEAKKMEYRGYEKEAHTYDPVEVEEKRYLVEFWSPDYTDMPTPFNFPTPQMFSDENPNAACSIM